MDNRCVNRVVNGAAVGGALGASIGRRLLHHISEKACWILQLLRKTSAFNLDLMNHLKFRLRFIRLAFVKL